MNINTDFLVSSNNYFQKEYPKTRIVLHYTAGSTARGAIETLSKPNKICVPYVVGKSGVIYQLYDPKYWAYSLGVKDHHYPKGYFEVGAIPIEIVNEGPLIKRGNDYCWWPRNWTYRYKGSTSNIIKYNFRGFDYHVKITKEQIKAVCELCDLLCIQFGINKKVLPLNKREELDLKLMKDFNGITSHINYRWDKQDISRGVFPYDELQSYFDRDNKAMFLSTFPTLTEYGNLVT